MTEITKQDYTNDMPDSLLRWAEAGEILYMYKDKQDSSDLKEFRLISKKNALEDVRHLVDKNGETTSEILLQPLLVGECLSTNDGVFLVVNEKLADIYGYGSVEEMLAIPDIAHAIYYKPDDRDHLIQIIKDVKTQEPVQKLNFQFIGRKKNTELVIISKDVRPYFHRDKAVFLHGYVTDITESSDDLEDLNPVFKCDLDGQRIIYVNNSMADFLGYTQQDLKKMNLSTIFSKYSQPDWLKELHNSRKIQDISVVINRKDGGTEEILLNVAVITAESGQNKNDLYIRGNFVSKLGEPVRKKLIDELRSSLSAPEHGLSLQVQEWSVRAACEIAREFTIDHFSDGELTQFIQNIKLVCEHYENQKNSRLKFLPELKFSLEDKIRLDVINSLRFFNYRSEILKNAFTLTQLAALDFSEQEVIQRIHNKLLLAIDREGELLFPSWQFDIHSPDKVIDQLPQVLLALDETPITQLSWLMLPHDAFDGRKPYEVLKAGTKEDKQRVVSEASGVGGW